MINNIDRINRNIKEIMRSKLSPEQKDYNLFILDQKSSALPTNEKMLVETIIHRKRLSLRETL